jgi:hypothetical protein
MMFCTQDELSLIWKKLTDGTECDADGLLEVSETVSAYIQTGLAPDIDVEQTLTLSTVAPYSDSNSDSTTISYTRIRLNKEASWGMWERKN